MIINYDKFLQYVEKRKSECREKIEIVERIGDYRRCADLSVELWVWTYLRECIKHPEAFGADWVEEGGEGHG